MSKKLIITLLVAAILLAGGFFAFRALQHQQAQNNYDQSSDKIADELVRDIVTQNSKDAYDNLFSPLLQNGYNLDYWNKTIFPLFKGYKAPIVRHAKGPVQSANSLVPNSYDPHLNQDAQQYQYDFALNGYTYRVTFVIFRLQGAWKVNELSGGYTI